MVPEPALSGDVAATNGCVPAASAAAPAAAVPEPAPTVAQAERPRSNSRSDTRARTRQTKDKDHDSRGDRDRDRDRERDRDRRRRRDDEDRDNQRRRSERRDNRDVKRRRRSGSSSSERSEENRRTSRRRDRERADNKDSRRSADRGGSERESADKRRSDDRARDRSRRKETAATSNAGGEVSEPVPGSDVSSAAATSADAKQRATRWGPLEEAGPQQQTQGAVITPEAARAEVARLGTLGQPTPQWLVQAAWGSGNASTPVPTGVVIGAAPVLSTTSAAAAARQAAVAKARRAAPPPPWMMAAKVFKADPGGVEGSAPGSPSSGSRAAAGSDGSKKKRPLNISDLSELQKNITEERNKLRLFVIKAKQENDERKERAKVEGSQDHHGVTDSEEYYSASAGEQFGAEGGQLYRVEAAIGRGVFSSVFQCKGTKDGRDYAIKFIRSNSMMRRAAEKEVEMYRRLAKYAPSEDPEGSRYLINLAAGTFEHSGHLCFVFDLMRCDMRFALQKYGQGGGLPLPTLAQYVRQIFLGLRALRKLKVVHADLKPDNLLMTMNKAEIQICDFGSAMDVSEQMRTSYLQPRYYRAPEIMLGIPYDMQIDIWSAGATLFELATGRILFTGKTNNVMLKQIIDVCGGFDKKMILEGEHSRKHFNASREFLHREPDSITGEPTTLPARLSRPPRPILNLLQAALTVPAAGVERATHDKWVTQLAELVSKCLHVDPADRIEPLQALELPFFKKDR